jgi:SAM-dependent methyltransferase
VRILARHFDKLIPQQASVLDVGCGDGLLASLLQQLRPDISISGIEVLVRNQTAIPIAPFDGEHIPSADHSVDVVMFVDVLHHTHDQMVLLREAKRVARQCILIKDHTCEGLFAIPTLRLMDWVGNAAYGVALPYNYWPAVKWLESFNALSLIIKSWDQSLGLYPFPASLLFERKLHVIAKLQV